MIYENDDYKVLSVNEIAGLHNSVMKNYAAYYENKNMPGYIEEVFLLHLSPGNIHKRINATFTHSSGEEFTVNLPEDQILLETVNKTFVEPGTSFVVTFNYADLTSRTLIEKVILAIEQKEKYFGPVRSETSVGLSGDEGIKKIFMRKNDEY